jgi:hypothetical protein
VDGTWNYLGGIILLVVSERSTRSESAREEGQEKIYLRRGLHIQQAAQHVKLMNERVVGEQPRINNKQRVVSTQHMEVEECDEPWSSRGRSI